MNLNGIKITWLGHATFLVDTPGGKKIIIDPWVTSNPSTPADKKKIDRLDVMLCTHGHSDHIGDAVNLAILPIGDIFTMGPLEAAYACRLLKPKAVIPMHYGTFPMLTGTPEEFGRKLKESGSAVELITMKPGETIS